MASLENPDPSGDTASRWPSQAMLFAQDLARMNALRKAYERLVPVPLDMLSPVLPEPHERDASILFSDIRGFTTIAERLRSDPNLLLSRLNEHFRVAVRAVMRCDGTVEKFLGDGLFATFGAWSDTPDHAARALAAAIAVIGAQEALNRRRSAEWGFRLEVGVALCTGRVVVGTMGPPERCELGIIGDPVNVAARLAALAGPSEVLLSESAYQAVAGQVSADLLGTRPIRGREGAIDLYRLQFGPASQSEEKD
jgi:adenylate cyclase